MNSLSPKEIQIVSDWGREELVKSLKVPAAFDIFQTLIQNGEINIPTISRKLCVKLGAKNGLFLTRLQKFIKTLRQQGADSINLEEHKEAYQLSLREKKDPEEKDTTEQETRTVASVEPNQHGATQISKTVFTSGNNNDKKTILVTVSFDDTTTKSAENDDENSEKQGKNEPESSEKEQNETKEKELKNDTDNPPSHKSIDIDRESDSSDTTGDGESNAANPGPPDPQQQFLEAHKKFLYAREEARFKINQKINNINQPKVTFQPRGWQNLFTLTKSSSDNEEEEIEEVETTNILVDDATPIQSMKQKLIKNEELSSYSDEETKQRRHHRRKKRRH